MYIKSKDKLKKSNISVIILVVLFGTFLPVTEDRQGSLHGTLASDSSGTGMASLGDGDFTTQLVAQT